MQMNNDLISQNTYNINNMQVYTKIEKRRLHETLIAYLLNMHENDSLHCNNS